MKWFRSSLTGMIIITIATFPIASCVKVTIGDEIIQDTTGNNNTSTVLEGTIDKSVTLAKGNYTLKGYVYVNNGAILTIEAGSVIQSDVTEKGALIIEK